VTNYTHRRERTAIAFLNAIYTILMKELHLGRIGESNACIVFGDDDGGERDGRLIVRNISTTFPENDA